MEKPIVVHRLSLNMESQAVQATVTLAYGDEATHRLVVDLRHGSEVVKLPPGSYAIAVQSDAVDALEAVTVYGADGVYPNCIVYDVTTNVTNKEGAHEAQFQISYKDEAGAFRSLASPRIALVVKKGILKSSGVASSEPYSAVVIAREKAVAAASAAETSATDAADKAKAAATSATDAADSAKVAATNATNAASAASAAASTAAKESAEAAAEQVRNALATHAQNAESSAQVAITNAANAQSAADRAEASNAEIKSALRDAEGAGLVVLGLEKAKIYGVDGVGCASGILTRTDDAVGLWSGDEQFDMNSFDRCFPWSDMTEVTDADGNVFVRIPKFYSKITQNEDGTYKHQISGVRHEGFTTLFIDGKGNELDYVLVGKYEGGEGNFQTDGDFEGKYYTLLCDIVSKPNRTVHTNIPFNYMREQCVLHGKGYQMYDFLIDIILKELFLVEYATTNSQSVMRGYVSGSNTAAKQTGATDSDPHRTFGDSAGVMACKYRGIENPWGNIWTAVDGIYFEQEKIHLNNDPTTYYDPSRYEYVGDRLFTSESAYNPNTEVVSTFLKYPLLYFTTGGAINNAFDSYYHDRYYVAPSAYTTQLYVGGTYTTGSGAGLFAWFTHRIGAHGNYGCRLCYKPIKGGVLNNEI